MLDDKSNGGLDKIKAFAEETGRSEQLQEKLDYLANYGAQETRCVLFHDSSPQCLTFHMHQKRDGEWEYWFSGGLIFYNAGDAGSAAPQFSTRISDIDKSGWSVNT
jgi:hypothetical protein